MSDQDWLDPSAWQACVEPNPDAPRVTLPVYDPELGAIAVVRAPDGREVFGADSPRGRWRGQTGQS